MFLQLLKPPKNPNFRTLMPLYYSMWTFSLVYRSKNLKFKWKAVSPCSGKVGHMQRRNSSVVQSFISESGVSQPMFGGAYIFFSFKWPPQVEISATFNCWFWFKFEEPLIVLYYQSTLTIDLLACLNVRTDENY